MNRGVLEFNFFCSNTLHSLGMYARFHARNPTYFALGHDHFVWESPCVT